MEPVNRELETIAKILGFLAKVDGKYTPGKVNKLMKKLGYDKMTYDELSVSIKRIKEDSQLYKAFEDSFEGRDTDVESANQEVVDDDGLGIAISTATVERELDKSAVRNYRKAQRQGGAQQYLANMIRSGLKDTLTHLDPVVVDDKELMKPVTQKTIVAFVTDWHIGATVHGVNGNDYNLDIAKARMKEYTETLLKQIKRKNPERVVILHGGDFVEAVDHRNINQAFDAQLNATEQLSEATRMFIELIDAVVTTGTKVTVGLVGGNHDRFTSNKKEAIYNDNLAYNVLDIVKLMQEMGHWDSNQLDIIDNSHDVYSLELPIYGKTIRLVHGDFLKRGDYKIASQIKDHPINMLLYGHLHSFKVVQEDINQLSIMAGSLQGNNSYSKQLGTPDSRANQLILTFDEWEQVPLIQPVFFEV